MKENGLTVWNYFGLSEEGIYGTYQMYCSVFRKKSLWTTEEGQAIQEDYKDFAVLCREKIRKAEAQLEASLAAAIKDN